jgi:hypothetical protein
VDVAVGAEGGLVQQRGGEFKVRDGELAARIGGSDRL